MKLFTQIKMFFELIRLAHIRGIVRDKGWRWVIVETYRECFAWRKKRAWRMDLKTALQRTNGITLHIFDNSESGFSVPKDYYDHDLSVSKPASPPPTAPGQDREEFT